MNPYRLLSVEDHFGANARVENPSVPLAELRTATIVGLYQKGAKAVPGWVTDSVWQQSRTDFFIAFQEWIPGVGNLMRAFEKRVSHDFVLTAPGMPEVSVQLVGMRLSAGDGSFQAFGARISPGDRAKIEPRTNYTLRPVNRSDTYRWAVASDVAPLRWDAEAR